MDEDKEFVRAKDCAFRLLSHCSRSRKEIEEHLKKRFPAKILQKTIRYLRRLDYLNDKDFARAWIQAKTQFNPKGLSLLRYQLKAKGVAEGIIEQVVKEFACGYDEVAAARSLVELRRSRYKGVDSATQKRRLYAYLRRRGFSYETIAEAMKLLGA